MKLFHSIAGTVRIRIISADIPSFLYAAGKQGISLSNLVYVDDLSICTIILRSDLAKLRKLAEKRGAKLSVEKKEGIFWTLAGLRQRPVLIVGLVLLFVLSWYLPSRILFIQVDGNISVPEKLILEQAASCGLSFGALRRTIRSEQIKNKLLGAIEQLQWVGVNTYGCRAVLSVKERTVVDTETEIAGVSSIVAAQDGVIQSCTVTKGNPLCSVGQAVQKGQVLISGYTDCGIRIQATQAEGEIFALTKHDLQAVSPIVHTQTGENLKTSRKYSLLIGKKRINFDKDSGISGTTCDKMYSEYYLMLPGRLRLPLGIAVETFTVYESQNAVATEITVAQSAQKYVQDYLLEHMVSGQIIDSSVDRAAFDEAYRFLVRFTCLEMIGRVQNEEILEKYGQSN